MKAATFSLEHLKPLPLSRMAVHHDAGVADGSARVPTWIKCKYLAVYFLFNLGLTLYNKAVMVQVCWDCLRPSFELVVLWQLGHYRVTHFSRDVSRVRITSGDTDLSVNSAPSAPKLSYS